MHRSLRPYVFLILGAALLAPLPGCNRDDVTPPITIQTPQPTRGVILTAEFSNFVTDSWFGIPIDIQAQEPGKLDITVDWTEDETWMFIYFGDTECGHLELTGGTCPFLISSETKDPKPRILYTDLLEPATYYLYLYNVPRVPGTGVGSDITEAVSLHLGLTVGFRLDSGEEGSVRLGRPRILSPPQI